MAPTKIEKTTFNESVKFNNELLNIKISYSLYYKIHNEFQKKHKIK